MVRIVQGTKSPQMVRNVYGTKSLWYEKSGSRVQNERCFMCVVNVAVVVGVLSCSPEWICYSSRCYFVSNVRVNQPRARADCHSQNAELVSISDQDEHDFVTSIWSVNQLLIYRINWNYPAFQGQEWSLHVCCIGVHSSQFDCMHWRCDTCIVYF